MQAGRTSTSPLCSSAVESELGSQQLVGVPTSHSSTPPAHSPAFRIISSTMNKNSCSLNTSLVKCWGKLLSQLTSLQTPPDNFRRCQKVGCHAAGLWDPVSVQGWVFNCLIKQNHFIQQLTRHKSPIMPHSFDSKMASASSWRLDPLSSSRAPRGRPLLVFHWSVGSSPASRVPCQLPARVRAATLLPAELNQSHRVRPQLWPDS